MFKKLLIVFGVLSFASFSQASDALVCISGSFGTNYGEPGHLMSIGGGSPNLVVFQNGIVNLYMIQDTQRAFQEYRLNTPFDLSVASLTFQSATTSISGTTVSYSGEVTPTVGGGYSSQYETYSIFVSADSAALTGFVELKDAGNGESGDMSSPLECSTAGVK